MNYTKCTGTPLALAYNENYIKNIKMACYCPYCCLVTEREPTPYKLVKTENGFIEIFDESYYEEKDKKYEEIKKSDNPCDPWSNTHCKPHEVYFYTNEEEKEDL